MIDLTKLKMRFLLTICLFLISTPSIATAQQSNKQHPSLTRAQTRAAERRLSDMGYWAGAIDGLFDPATRSALIAFQKWEGRPITGRLTLVELQAIRTSAFPKARELGYEHVEVDLDRPSVPIQPASHGCIRIPMFAAHEMSKLLKVGTIVLVYDKVSFVSAKVWVENPKLKPTADIE